RTRNAILANRFAGGWAGIGAAFVLITLLSEALLLIVAGQAGFIDGPRVMANMAVDSYLPHRFSQLSDRLTMSYGVLLMGSASLLALAYTGAVFSFAGTTARSTTTSGASTGFLRGCLSAARLRCRG